MNQDSGFQLRLVFLQLKLITNYTVKSKLVLVSNPNLIWPKSNLISELLLAGSVDLDERDTPVFQLNGGLLDFWNRSTMGSML